MANSVCWHGQVFRREDGHVLRRAFDLEVEFQRKTKRLRKTCKKHVLEECVKVCLRREDALCR